MKRAELDGTKPETAAKPCRCADVQGFFCLFDMQFMRFIHGQTRQRFVNLLNNPNRNDWISYEGSSLPNLPYPEYEFLSGAGDLRQFTLGLSWDNVFAM
ncbi:hypothetical protein D7M11_35295 [Paenibacillus ginsengarvi]|uniref:Uncharacterized protein n=1 Tax=Paenibacillus ginsengarvi TaxID=400777 RepID=A0A3B0AMV2_9BACL|nr:hypothetical protein D7M11_35295 [Paenibacillus ginsengarvi]